MRQYAVLLQKKSLDGSTNVKWVMAGVKPFNGQVTVSQDLRPSKITQIPSEHGCPRAFVATCLVIWEAVTWDQVSREAVELWANGAFMVGGEE